MANGTTLGLLPGGSAFSGETRAEIDRILQSPTPGDVVASRSQLGLGGVSDPTAAPSREPSFLRTAGRVLGGIVSLGASEQIRADNIRRQQQDELTNQAIRAEIRTRNLQNASAALGFVSDLAKNVAVIQDPQQRDLIRASGEASVRDVAPDLEPLFGALVERSALAFVDHEKQLATVFRHSSTAGRYAAINNGSLDGMPAELMVKSVAEVDRGLARDFLPTARTMANRLVRFAEQRQPERLSELKKSDKTLSSDEVSALAIEFRDLDPDFNDPGKLSQFLAAVEEFPEQVGNFRAQKDVARRRELVEKKSIEAAFREPRQPKNAVNVRTPEPIAGKSNFLSFDGGRTIQTDAGPVAAPAGSFIGQITGTPEQIGLGAPPKNQVAKLREAEINTRNFLSAADRAIQLFRERPEVLGVAGEIARIGNELAATAEGVAALVDVSFEIGGSPASAQEVRDQAEEGADESLEVAVRRLGAVGADRARVRSAVVGLAFTAAAASGQTGRGVSDRDVERFIHRIGESASPETFASVLEDVRTELIENFENFHRVVSRDLPNAPPLPNLSEGREARRSSRRLIVEEIE